MKNPKIWAVLGATDGLGNAAIKYLIANDQIVIAFITDYDPANKLFEKIPDNLHLVRVKYPSKINTNSELAELMLRYGAIDFVINNSNYKLFNDSQSKSSRQIHKDVSKSVSDTAELIKAIIPYLRKLPKGNVINIPPQLCLAMIPDRENAKSLSAAMDLFLEKLHNQLREMDFGLTFLQPGERFTNFNI